MEKSLLDKTKEFMGDFEDEKEKLLDLGGNEFLQFIPFPYR